MSASRIEWTGVTWNPVTGCSKISAGCANCYAERMARRLQAMGQRNYVQGFRVIVHEDMLERPLTDDELSLESNMQKVHIASSDKPATPYSLDAVISVGRRECHSSRA